ncbi:uncharacterized protein LOC129762689 [Toxorhynchites rutilus septentrionalis]|uniref:uncharacterized protein LOC129762689 n=1 Tax=Toxorhynchites rutilus septentrionalis TaxID=329112 RepID=UPI002478A855|nr:uncharacterized protein LOC129762689 [Toxorhynchites rutilus septentrionalis]
MLTKVVFGWSVVVVAVLNSAQPARAFGFGLLGDLFNELFDSDESSDQSSDESSGEMVISAKPNTTVMVICKMGCTLDVMCINCMKINTNMMMMPTNGGNGNEGSNGNAENGNGGNGNKGNGNGNRIKGNGKKENGNKGNGNEGNSNGGKEDGGNSNKNGNKKEGDGLDKPEMGGDEAEKVPKVEVTTKGGEDEGQDDTIIAPMENKQPSGTRIFEIPRRPGVLYRG